MQEKQYPFLDSDVPGIFDDLLKANLIEFPEMKQSQEARKMDDPKYYKYHHLVGMRYKIALCSRIKLCNWLDKVSCNTTHTINEDSLLEKKDSSNANECMSTITFTDEDLLLGSKPHKCPLFVAGYPREQKVNKILIDGGSAVNILSLRTLKELGVPMDELSNSRLMIQGFNQGDKELLVL
ncbi:UNVERIFIED_CONTAM: hypothetical protein Slati_1721700 [Sesamum latifolium]|uniref:Uncharacterized protein n=1 Tax=Sesamum latifolium TaxID=2727402 RepID=A0AAW2WWV8_9LAMI